jgi:hypothetical protein
VAFGLIVRDLDRKVAADRVSAAVYFLPLRANSLSASFTRLFQRSSASLSGFHGHLALTLAPLPLDYDANVMIERIQEAQEAPVSMCGGGAISRCASR